MIYKSVSASGLVLGSECKIKLVTVVRIQVKGEDTRFRVQGQTWSDCNARLVIVVRMQVRS